MKNSMYVFAKKLLIPQLQKILQKSFPTKIEIYVFKVDVSKPITLDSLVYFFSDVCLTSEDAYNSIKNALNYVDNDHFMIINLWCRNRMSGIREHVRITTVWDYHIDSIVFKIELYSLKRVRI